MKRLLRFLRQFFCDHADKKFWRSGPFKTAGETFWRLHYECRNCGQWGMSSFPLRGLGLPNGHDKPYLVKKDEE